MSDYRPDTNELKCEGYDKESCQYITCQQCKAYSEMQEQLNEID